ncbi:MAG: TolC family protein [Leptospirales bacterium]
MKTGWMRCFRGLSLILGFGLGFQYPGQSFAIQELSGPVVPITRDEVYSRALKNNPEIELQASEYASQSEEVGIQKATYFPQINLSVEQLYLNTPLLGLVFPNEEGLAPEAILPSLTQEIYDFGRRHNSVRAARLSRQSARWSLSEARLAVVWKAAIAFDKLSMFQHLLASAIENEKSAILHLEQTKVRLEKGLAIWPDVTEAKVYWQKSRLQLVQIQNEIHKSQTELAYGMGERHFSLYQAVGNVSSESIPLDGDKLTQFALLHRPLLLALDKKDEQREVLVHRAYDEHLPKISLFANVLLLYGVPPNVSGAPQNSGLFLPAYQTGIGLSVPIFTGMRIVHQTEEARDEYRKEKAETRLARIRVVRNVRKALFNLETQEKKVKLDGLELENATANREMVEKSYRRGLVDSVTRIRAQSEYVTAQETLIADRYRQVIIQDALSWQIGVMPVTRKMISSRSDSAIR